MFQTNKLIKFSGSRNYVDEHVSNLIWEADKGTKIVVEITDNNLCEVTVNL